MAFSVQKIHSLQSSHRNLELRITVCRLSTLTTVFDGRKVRYLCFHWHAPCPELQMPRHGSFSKQPFRETQRHLLVINYYPPPVSSRGIQFWVGTQTTHNDRAQRDLKGLCPGPWIWWMASALKITPGETGLWKADYCFSTQRKPTWHSQSWGAGGRGREWGTLSS